MEKSIYLHLTSNKSKFNFKLPEGIDLDDTWTVGLSEVSIPKSKNEKQILEVKSNIIKNSYINDQNSNLLRFISTPNRNKFGDRITREFTRIYYYPVNSNLAEYEIEILNEGQSLNYEQDNIYLTLHFQKIELTEQDLEPLPEGDIVDKFNNKETVLDLLIQQ